MLHDENTPILVILMRNDLDSMNPGKACAQASHAANQMVEQVTAQHFNDRSDKQIQMLLEWQGETGKGFGTVHVRAGWWDKIDAWFNIEASKLDASCVVYGRVFDPTYPVRDGMVTYYVPQFTCAYAFGRRADLALLEATFGFMP
jgi:hypothetical protein